MGNKPFATRHLFGFAEHCRSDMSFKGNKSNLPSKPCQCCGREMSWRKSWAKNWEQIKYCSDACRKHARSIKAGALRPLQETSP